MNHWMFWLMDYTALIKSSMLENRQSGCDMNDESLYWLYMVLLVYYEEYLTDKFQNTNLTPIKYRTFWMAAFWLPPYVIMHRSYKLLKVVQFLAYPLLSLKLSATCIAKQVINLESKQAIWNPRIWGTDIANVKHMRFLRPNGHS